MDLNAAMDLVHWSHHHRHCYYGTIHLQRNLNPLLGKVLNALLCEALYDTDRHRSFNPLGIWDALTSGLIKLRKLDIYFWYPNSRMDSLFVFLSTGRSMQEFKMEMWMSEENKVTLIDALIEV